MLIDSQENVSYLQNISKALQQNSIFPPIKWRKLDNISKYIKQNTTILFDWDNPSPEILNSLKTNVIYTPLEAEILRIFASLCFYLFPKTQRQANTSIWDLMASGDLN